MIKHHNPPGKQLPGTTSAKHEVVIQERTTCVEETEFVSSDPNPSGAPSAVVIRDNSGLIGYVDAPKPPPQVTHHRPQEDPSPAQFQLLQNREQLTYVLQCTEQ